MNRMFTLTTPLLQSQSGRQGHRTGFVSQARFRRLGLALALTVVFSVSSSKPIIAQESDASNEPPAMSRNEKDQAKEQAAAVREQARQAREQAREHARQQRDQARAEMELAHAAQVHIEHEEADLPEPPEPPEAPEAPDPFGQIGMAFEGIMGGTSARTESPVVVAAKLDAGEIAQSQEDLSIMHRILLKAAGSQGDRDPQEFASGIVLSTFPGLKQPRSFQFEGYGAVFLLRVKYPLVAAPASKEESKPEKQQNQTWEETKREIYGGQDGASRVFMNKTIRKESPPARFDSEQVGRLQRAVSLSLKNASNLRHLQADDRVLVVITGPKAGSPKGESTLTLQARRSDIDSFVKGNLKDDEFLKKVAARAY
jgi:hypothetical protein